METANIRRLEADGDLWYDGKLVTEGMAKQIRRLYKVTIFVLSKHQFTTDFI